VAPATPPSAASSRSDAAPPGEGLTPPAPRRIPDSLPDLSLPGLDGRTHRLSDWKGHALLVNFWASWCEPCRREIPLLERLRHERSGRGLEIVGIALDFRDATEKYARTAGIDYPVLVGEQGGYEAAAAFGMDPVLPFSVFADATGRIITVKVGELHPDEAGFILDRLTDLAKGRVSLEAARDQIASGMAQLRLRRVSSGSAAAH
jgi:thiol-disulfide isomerase/thioredoxin